MICCLPSLLPKVEKAYFMGLILPYPTNWCHIECDVFIFTLRHIFSLKNNVSVLNMSKPENISCQNLCNFTYRNL